MTLVCIVAAIFGLVVCALYLGQMLAPVTDWEQQPTVSHTVSQGETLWSIAASTNPNADPREVVYAIRNINDIDPGHLRPGLVLKVPVSVGI
jgi:Tfp pilus assembly protein FimV